jgi:pimeloyl-ACP methyl ester carboxylesterase
MEAIMFSTALQSFKNSTVVRFVPSAPTIPPSVSRTGLRAASYIAPSLAGLWAERLFLTPPPTRFEDQDLFAFMDAHSDFVPHLGRRLAAWRWGDSDAPAVLLAHGWGGHSAQMVPLARPLLAAGYRVIAFDQPAHGLSEGQLTGLPDFAAAIAAVARRYGGVTAVVGHSLGGAALALALSQYRDLSSRVKRAVLINAPSDISGFSRRFARLLKLPERVRRHMQEAIEERYGVRWTELEPPRLAAHLDAKGLIIHDRGDREVPIAQGEALAGVWLGARLLRTEGLGHVGILSDEHVGLAVADFISGGSGFAGAARPALPEPAPLY